jgi:alpha-tubulin suppressor-like RCC1 family protein/Flp pilus assembly pilin Flp
MAGRVVIESPLWARLGAASWPRARVDRKDQGRGLLEYGLALALIAFVVIGVVTTTVGRRTNTGFCAVTGGLGTTGVPLVMGLGTSGELGNGNNLSSGTPVTVSGSLCLSAISGGYGHNAGLSVDGAVWTWGSNADGELGNGTTTPSSVPVRVSGLSGVTAVSAGAYFTTALKKDGTVWSWGRNNHAQLGAGIAADALAHPNPVRVTGLAGGKVTQIASNCNDGSALKSDGTVWFWGDNSVGQLGNGTAAPANSASAVQVTTGLPTGITAIARTCDAGVALGPGGTVWGWGWNGGQYGNSSVACPAGICPPMEAWAAGPPCTGPSYFTGAVAIAGGFQSEEILKSDGTVYETAEAGCGGAAPQQVAGLSNVATIAYTGNFGLALFSDGTVMGWGDNTYGELGGANACNPCAAVSIPGLTKVRAIAAAQGYDTLALVPPI